MNNICIEVLRLSEDGDLLSPRHLKLVEMVVNKRANEAGHEELRRIYEALQAGQYNDWYFGIQGLTLSHDGFVRWQGEVVEHYSFLEGNYCAEAFEAAHALVERLKRE